MRIITSLLVFFSLYSSAQCIVDAGPPIHLCNDTIGKTIEARIVQGVAPFNYTWSYTYHYINDLIPPNTASDFLNDTTVLRPFLRTFYIHNKLQYMKIEVRDSTGAVCSDSVAVSHAQFWRNLDATPIWIGEGDSLKLCAPVHFGGGFLPYKDFKWTDASNISGSDSAACFYTTRFFKKDCSNIGFGYVGKTYRVTGKDSLNCPWWDYVDVAFLPTGLNESNTAANVYCVYHSQTGMLDVQWPELDAPAVLSVIDLQGKCLFTQTIQAEKHVFVKDKIDATGVYIITLTKNNRKQLTQRIFIEK
jgi:hypothetical protein